ncbi:MAG: TolB family protein [Acidimicrobiales bacterium]
MDADGTNPHPVRYDASDPSFSPDGKAIVYAASLRKNAAHQVFRMNADGTNATQLTGGNWTGGANYSPNW